MRRLSSLLFVGLASLALWVALPRMVFAAAPTMTAVTADTNNDATVDKITITFSEAADLDDGNAGDGFTSLALSAGCTIPNSDYNNDSTTTLNLTSLTGCTSGNTGITPTVTYTAVANCTTAMSICDAAGANQMANGANTTSTDGAKPVITAVAFGTATVNSYLRNSVTLTYSEPITFSNDGGSNFFTGTTERASSSTLAGMTTTRQIDGIATWASTNGGDAVSAAATYNTVSLPTTTTLRVAFNAASAGSYWTATTGATTPVVTPVGDANDVKDLAGLAVNDAAATVNATSAAAWDVAVPTVSSTYSCDNDADGDINRLEVKTSESVIDATIATTDFEGDNDTTNDGVGEEAPASVDTSSLNCDGEGTDADADDNKFTLVLTAGIAGTEKAYVNHVSGQVVTDYAGNKIASGDALGTETDMAGPVMTAVAFGTATVSSYLRNVVSFTYSEAVTFSNDGGSNFFTGTTERASSATLAAMTTTRQLDGIATWASTNGGDAVSAAATGNTVSLTSATVLRVAFNTATTTSYWTATSGATTPVVTQVSDVNDLKDLEGNAANTGAATVNATSAAAWDVTVPTVSTTYSCDSDLDGDVNRIQINFSESVVDAIITTADLEADNDNTNDGTGEETPASVSTSSQGCDGSSADTDADDQKISINLTAGISGTEAAFVNVIAGQIVLDYAGNLLAAASGAGTETDKALPVITSSTPTSGQIGFARTTAFSLVFSEAISSLTYSITPFASLTTATSLPASTISVSGVKTPGSNTFTIATAPDADANAFSSFVSTGTTSISFFVASSNSSSSSTTVAAAPSYSIELTAPNGGSIAASAPTPITWSSTQLNGSAMSVVNISYSADGGATYTTIANNEVNDGTYLWTVPAALNGASILIRVQGTDGVTVLATDVSSGNVGVGVTPTTTVVVTPDEEEVDADEEEEVVGWGVSPVTGLQEEINLVEAGDYIRGMSFDTVYFIQLQNGSLVRRPFMDQQTFMTWEDDFDSVRSVTDATLTSVTLGMPMLPQAGVVLVKIQSDPKTYLIEADAGGNLWLRWITSESVAVQMYGSAWADYIIDIPSTFLQLFSMGEDVESAEAVDNTVMKTRMELNS